MFWLMNPIEQHSKLLLLCLVLFDLDEYILFELEKELSGCQCNSDCDLIEEVN